MDTLARFSGAGCCAASLVAALVLGAPTPLCWLLGAACGVSVAANALALAADHKRLPECDIHLGICPPEDPIEFPGEDIAPTRAFTARLETTRTNRAESAPRGR